MLRAHVQKRLRYKRLKYKSVELTLHNMSHPAWRFPRPSPHQHTAPSAPPAPPRPGRLPCCWSACWRRPWWRRTCSQWTAGSCQAPRHSWSPLEKDKSKTSTFTKHQKHYFSDNYKKYVITEFEVNISLEMIRMVQRQKNRVSCNCFQIQTYCHTSFMTL